ncbi:hypothetical protein ZWY2020_043081 [Hordeum vulgare]|nr:hypothetical protein ZWY2020_043081 [Hordeum vulgare]
MACEVSLNWGSGLAPPARRASTPRLPAVPPAAVPRHYSAWPPLPLALLALAPARRQQSPARDAGSPSRSVAAATSSPGNNLNQGKDRRDVFPEAVTSKVERDVETVINVLHPGPIGIVEHKFTDAEIREAQVTVRSAVEKWRRNSTLERNLGTGSFDKSK